jgi:hypothetical protein
MQGIFVQRTISFGVTPPRPDFIAHSDYRRHTLLNPENAMRPKSVAASLVIALAISGCSPPTSGPDETEKHVLDFGEIKAQVHDGGDGTVAVGLSWTFRRNPSFPMNPAELPPVYLFNAGTNIRAVPEGGMPEWSGDEILLQATVSVPADAWQQGCWQARYILVGLTANEPIVCLNEPPVDVLR